MPERKPSFSQERESLSAGGWGQVWKEGFVLQTAWQLGAWAPAGFLFYHG